MEESTWLRLITPVRRRIKTLIGRGIGHLVDATGALQRLQLELRRGELLGGIEHLEGYGRTANPPDGWEGLSASLDGDRVNTVVISAYNRQYRVRGLSTGEQVLYDDLGNVIWFKRDHILIDSMDKVQVVAPVVEIHAPTMNLIGNVYVTGNLVASGSLADGTGTIQQMRDTYNEHTNALSGGGNTLGPNQHM